MQYRLAATQKDLSYNNKKKQSNVTHTNKYSTLNIIENIEEETSNTKTEPKTSPIFVQNMTNYTAMLNNIKTRINHTEFMCKTAANNSIKINTHSVEAYQKLVQHFKQNNVEFHTY